MATRVAAAHDRLQQAVAGLRAILETADGAELCKVLSAVEAETPGEPVTPESGSGSPPGGW